MATVCSDQEFWNKVDYLSQYPCWVWAEGLTTDGYGQFTLGYKPMHAHRMSYILINGFISKGLQLDHLCRNRRCVNPSHLEPVTNKVNILRGEGWAAINARKTHCVRGHAFTVQNTYIRNGGWRVCRECDLGRKRPKIPKSEMPEGV